MDLAPIAERVVAMALEAGAEAAEAYVVEDAVLTNSVSPVKTASSTT